MEAELELKDDPNIPSEELLYRGIHLNHVRHGEISSSAFKSRTNPHTSVDRASLSTPQQTHARRPNDMGVAQVATYAVRALTIGVASDPLPENPAHALIIRDFSLNKTQWVKIARKLAKACTWAICPPQL